MVLRGPSSWVLDPRSAGEHIVLWVMLIAAGKVLVYGDRIAGANNLGAVESKCATVDTAAGGGLVPLGAGRWSARVNGLTRRCTQRRLWSITAHASLVLGGVELSLLPALFLVTPKLRLYVAQLLELFDC